MKRLIFGLLFLGILIGIIVWVAAPQSSIQLRIQSAEIEENIVEIEPQKNSQIPSKESINSQKLYQYLEDIVGERYGESDREFIRNYLVEKLAEFGFTPQLSRFETGVNIIAKRMGTHPELGSVLVAAHYDTVRNSPGADDNGTGLAVVLEIARLLAKETPLTLEIAFFDQEENGLQGSFAFTTQPENLETLKAVIILDMIGYACHTSGCQTYPPGLPVQTLLKAAGIEPSNTGEFLAVVGETQHLELLKAFQQQTLKTPTILTVPVPLKGLLTPDVLRSDHAPFWYQGIPAVLVTDTAELRSPHYHQPSDSINNLDRSFFVGSAQIILNVVQDLLSQTQGLN